MKSKTHYYHIRFFERYFKEFKDSGKRFEYVKTAYTKKLIDERNTLFFNNKGEKDDRILSMISNVRKDAIEFLESGKSLSDEDFDYFKLVGVPPVGELIAKVDIKGAYWKYAVNNGIVKTETDIKLSRLYDNEPYKIIKDAKTKILGCLATKKVHRIYDKGKMIDENVDEQITKDLYIDINRGIDRIMAECAGTVKGCFYYYWDCMFMERKFVPDAIEFFRLKDLDVRVNETKIDFVPLKDSGYLVAQKDEKMYFVKKEDKRLIKHLIPEEDE